MHLLKTKIFIRITTIGVFFGSLDVCNFIENEINLYIATYCICTYVNMPVPSYKSS